MMEGGTDSGFDEIPVPAAAAAGKAAAPPAAPAAAPASRVPAASDQDVVGPIVNVISRRVTVSDPQKEGDGMTAYYTYRVNSTELKTSRHSSVSRRYSGFDYLQKQLAERHPGVIVPYLPEKNAVMGKVGSEEFIEARRIGLQNFLVRVESHPQLAVDDKVTAFMEMSDGDWSKEVAKWDAAQGSVSARFGSLFKKAKDTTATYSATYTEAGRAAANNIDPDFTLTDTYVTDLALSLESIRNSSSSSICRQKDYADSITIFGESCTQLAAAERSHNSERFGAALDKLASTAANVAKLHRQVADSERLELLMPVRDYIFMTERVRDVVMKRGQLLANYASTANTVAEKKQALETVQSRANEDALQAALQEQERSKASYDDCCTTMAAELERFNREKDRDFRRYLRKFAISQIAAAERAAAMWADVLPAIDQVSLCTHRRAYAYACRISD